jgi:hypothetical protein
MLISNRTDFNIKIKINDLRMLSFHLLALKNIILNVHKFVSSVTRKLACIILCVWEYYAHDSWIKLQLEMAALWTMNYCWVSFRVKSQCRQQRVTTNFFWLALWLNKHRYVHLVHIWSKWGNNSLTSLPAIMYIYLTVNYFLFTRIQNCCLWKRQN